LQRRLHWSHSCAISFCIMSPLTGITGTKALSKAEHSLQKSDLAPSLTGRLVLPVLLQARSMLWFAGLYGQGLLYGGPAVLVWGWVFASTMTFIVGLAMSELSSAFPVLGSLYFWSFMLTSSQWDICKLASRLD